MGISLAPDPTNPNNPSTAAPVDPLAKPKPVAPLTTPAPLASEYPSAPSTTGTPQNRLQLATTAFDTFAKSTAPQYTADLREATQRAAGSGNIGSGGLRTTYGNLANQRALALDTERSNLVNAATTGTIADQQAAAGLGIQQQNADTSRLGTTGNLSLGQGQLDLAKTGQSADIANQQAQLQLAQTGQAASIGQGQQALDLQRQQADLNAALSTAGLTGLFNGQETLAAKQAAVQNAIAQGQLTNQQGQLALAQLAQQTSANQGQQQIDLAKAGQATSADQAQQQIDLAKTTAGNTQANEQARIQLAKDQLAQSAEQFGLSLAQQKDLATLADQTANRQIDVNTVQGKNALLVQIASILGQKDASTINPGFLQSVIAAITGSAAQDGGGTTGTTGTTGKTGTTGYGGGDSIFSGLGGQGPL